jgi:hypothetical protein
MILKSSNSTVRIPSSLYRSGRSPQPARRTGTPTDLNRRLFMQLREDAALQACCSTSVVSGEFSGADGGQR